VSPFYAADIYYHAEQFLRGNRLDKSNLLRWDYIKFNLSGSPDFNPSLPWVMKWDNRLNNLTAVNFAYVDDLRISGVDEETAWALGRQLASRLQYYGIQDALRKQKLLG